MLAVFHKIHQSLEERQHQDTNYHDHTDLGTNVHDHTDLTMIK